MDSKDLYIMLEDTAVMRVNFDTGIYNILQDKLLPWELKGRIRNVEDVDLSTQHGVTQASIILSKNYNAVISFLSRRVLSLSRDNAKKLYQAFNFSQSQDPESKAKIAISCRAVSLQDNYWVKLDGDDTKWKDINLRHNSLSEAVAQITLHGTSLTLQGKITTPEWSGSGTYAKAWRRLGNDLVLLKAGSKDPTESQIEVMVSKLLDKTNVNHLQYWKTYDNDTMVCACKCMTTDDISILPAENFSSYCNANGLDYYEEVLKIDADAIYKMWIVDYLVSNRDRHGMNWGFFYNARTMEILGCHPLYDHNNAFDKAMMENPNTEYAYGDGMTIQQAAKKAAKFTNFKFTKPVTRRDFLTTSQYDSFIKRTTELGIQIPKENQCEVER